MMKQEERSRKHKIILGVVLAILAVLAYAVIILAVYMLK